MTGNTTQVRAAIIAVLILIAVGIFIMLNCGCNRQIFDIHYRFNKAIMKMPDGTCKTIEIKSWRDYENSD